MSPPPPDDRFEELVSPHLDAAYNLARWLMKRESDADDVMQEACLRAWRALPSLRGGDARPWLLSIVRNACFTALARQRGRGETEWNDDMFETAADEAPSPEISVLRALDRDRVRQAIESLPPLLREAIVLRELEGLSYRDIAATAAVPIGTVMSRLSRARDRLQQQLSDPGGPR